VASNPFVYGEVVPPAAFVGRDEELAHLRRDLEDGQKVFLISPRRYGKSSLIRHALRAAARRGALTCEVTVASFSSYLGFLEGYTRALAALYERWDLARSWLSEALAGVSVTVRPESGDGPGRVLVTFPDARTDRELSQLAAAVFALPARLADARRRRLIVALDEFQAIAGFNGGSVEQSLRSAIQHQRRVGYVFAGSEPSLMERMLGPRRPFYKAGPVMRLEKIPSAVFAAFIESRFTRTGVKPEPGVGAAHVELAGNVPYDVQRLAHETWDDVHAEGRRRVDLEDLHRTLSRLLAEHHMVFEAMWQRLTLPQRATLRAVVLADGRELLSTDVRQRCRLGGPSTVQGALAALVREDVIARDDHQYVVIDSLLREWVARRTH
jgi:uncharacterized protein